MLTIDYRLLGIQEGDQVLDVGCGEGRHSWGMYNQIDCLVYALDIEEENLKKARYTFYLMDEQEKRSGKWLAIRGDAMSLPFKSASFDKVVCSEVLEHLHDDGRGMKELVRVLKANGMLAVSVPTYLTETIYWKLSKDYCNSPGGHVRKYRARELIGLLRQNNLYIYAIRHKHSLHSIYWLLRCLFGIKKEKALIPSLYHKFLVWDIKTKSKPIRLLDDVLNHLFPKSIVIYAQKGDDGGHSRAD
jgi:SAM-dependent methyltransferase